MAITTPGNIVYNCLLFTGDTIAPKRHHDDAPDAVKKAKLEVVTTNTSLSVNSCSLIRVNSYRKKRYHNV